MARTITDPDAAATFARVIASDLSIYNEAALIQSLRDGRPFEGLEDVLVEARLLFVERVLASLEPVPLLVRTFVEFFGRWATERGLPIDGLARALATRIAPIAEPLALVVRAGLADPEIGRVVPLFSGVFVLGRTNEADIELDAVTVAGRHTQLSVTTGAGAGAHIEVQDLESHSGTWVNGEIVRAPTRLAPGDVLQVGTVVLELVRT
jgi:hypothetical protein